MKHTPGPAYLFPEEIQRCIIKRLGQMYFVYNDLYVQRVFETGYFHKLKDDSGKEYIKTEYYFEDTQLPPALIETVLDIYKKRNFPVTPVLSTEPIQPEEDTL